MAISFRAPLLAVVLATILALPATSLARVTMPSAADRVVASQETPSGGESECIPNEEDESCLPVAPESDRVDLNQPTFSDPTRITNPLFPIADLHSVVMLGRVDRLPFRTEVTLLPEPKVIEWNGQEVEVLVTQYAAFLDGRIQEVALDWYAQADDGSVWYFGEDVFNYEDGVVANDDGTWIAGEDGPAGMIMPADPQVGDVYRPENIPGEVFEEVTVQSVDQTVHGPRGPIDGAIVVQELHQDGGYEAKIFAPGYGEFLTGAGGELEAVALAVPTDALADPLPAEFERLTTGANEIFDAVEAGNWDRASSTLDTMIAAWNTAQAGDVPALLDAQLSDALVYLVAAVDARQPDETRQVAIDVARSALDLQLQYHPVVEIDLARFDLWTRQVQVDVSAGDAAAVRGDAATLAWIRDRFRHVLDEANAASVDDLLDELQLAADGDDLTTAGEAAVQLRVILGDETATT